MEEVWGPTGRLRSSTPSTCTGTTSGCWYGLGVYSDSVNSSALNLRNPAFRDSFTIYKNGWTVIRFKVSIEGRLC